MLNFYFCNMKSLLVYFLLIITFAAGAYVPKRGGICSPEMNVVATEAREGYDCCYITFKTEKEERISAYLLVPQCLDKRSKCPAVVMLHDHGARFDIGKEKLVRPMASVLDNGADDHIMKSSRQWIDKNFDGVYLADSLASLGYVVLVADALYWGERSSEDAQRWSELSYGNQQMTKVLKDSIKVLKKKIYDGQKLLYDELYSRGEIWAEKMLRDDIASVRLLRSLPFVDKDRIGAFGFSMGAHRCWMLAAFCKNVKCGVALSWMTTLDREERMKASDYSMAIMPMRETMDFGDIGKFLTPKPMLFLSGTTDHLFPKEKVEKAYQILQNHYSSDPESLRTLFFEGGHHCGKDVQKTIIEYFDKVL